MSVAVLNVCDSIVEVCDAERFLDDAERYYVQYLMMEPHAADEDDEDDADLEARLDLQAKLLN